MEPLIISPKRIDRHRHPSPIMVSKYFEAGYPNTTGFRKVVKVTIMVKKKDGMSDEDFIEVTRSKLPCTNKQTHK